MKNNKKERQRVANYKYYKNHTEKSKAASRQWKLKNKEKVNQYKRDYYRLHPEKSKEETKRYVEKNINKVRARRHKYYLDHTEKFKEAGKTRYEKHKEIIKIKVKQWAKNNPEKVKKISRDKKLRYRKNPIKRLNFNISYGIWLSLHGAKKNQHWESLVGYNIDQLKAHLEKLFIFGMTWENYGKWHIDHKIPKTAFNYTCSGDIDFKRCWALSNLQPMWAKENLIKGNKLSQPFQPSLALPEIS
jgi:hypothetical protein